MLLKLYNIRLVENKPLLQAEAADVKTTKLIIPAATGIPIKVNTSTNGLLAAFSCVHGLMHKMTNMHLHRKIKSGTGILLMADGIFFCGLAVSAADTPTNSTPTNEKTTI